jgi:hypothetical protein
VAQVLPKDEDFAAPDWLTPAGGTTQSMPWFFWYMGFKPTDGVSNSAGDGANYPFKVGGALETYGRQELYIDNSSQNPVMPVLMTDSAGVGDLYQRSVLCREEDSVAVEDIDFKVEFGIMGAGGGQLGATFGGTGSTSPTAAGREQFPDGDTTDTDDNHLNMGSGPGVGNWSPAGSMSSASPTLVNLWSAWNGNSLFFRAGSGYPLVAYNATAGTSSRAWWCTHVQHYAFSAYPVVNSGQNRVDLYLELWQVKFSGTGSTAGTARRLIQQVVDGGASKIDFSEPYFLRVKCDNNGSGHVDMNCFIGKVKRDWPLDNLDEAQCFKDGVFGNNTYTVAASGVTHTAASGNVEDSHSDKIATFADKTFGWGMGKDRTINVTPRLDPDSTSTTPQYMSVIEGVFSVEVKDISASTILYRDEFERTANTLQIATPQQNPITGKFGTPGTQANGMFTSDAFANEYGSGVDEIRRLMLWTDSQTDTTAPNDFVTIDYDADDSAASADQNYNTMRMFVHGRPSTQFFNHHRSIQFKPGDENPSGGTAPYSAVTYEVGIMLRGTSNGGSVSGVMALLQWTTNAQDTVTSAVLKIVNRTAINYDKTNPSSDDVVIAQQIWSATTSPSISDFNTAYALYDGNFKTLGFRAETYPSASTPQAAALYHVTLNGSPVELTSTAAPYQSDTSSPYQVIENGPMYFNGRTEMFSFFASMPEIETGGSYRIYNPITMKAWTEGAITAEPVTDDPDNQASISVSGEGSAVGNLNATSGALDITGGGTWEVEVEVTVESAYPLYRIPFDSGHTFTGPATSKPRRRWRVMIRSAPLSVFQSLQTFFNSHLGSETPFNFQVPISNDGTVSGDTADATESVVAWFSSSELSVREVGPKVYDLGFSVDEELNA